uniref:Trinucleotide repeat containing adaptor 6A n=1 Tax=Callorhinchus milii TaxID=7868 RepID=A0A4W3IGM6_CALMI
SAQQQTVSRYPPREVPPRFRHQEQKQLLKRGQQLPTGAGTLTVLKSSSLKCGQNVTFMFFSVSDLNHSGLGSHYENCDWAPVSATSDSTTNWDKVIVDRSDKEAWPSITGSDPELASECMDVDSASSSGSEKNLNIMASGSTVGDGDGNRTANGNGSSNQFVVGNVSNNVGNGSINGSWGGSRGPSSSTCQAFAENLDGKLENGRGKLNAWGSLGSTASGSLNPNANLGAWPVLENEVNPVQGPVAGCNSGTNIQRSTVGQMLNNASVNLGLSSHASWGAVQENSDAEVNGTRKVSFSGQPQNLNTEMNGPNNTTNPLTSSLPNSTSSMQTSELPKMAGPGAWGAPLGMSTVNASQLQASSATNGTSVSQLGNGGISEGMNSGTYDATWGTSGTNYAGDKCLSSNMGQASGDTVNATPAQSSINGSGSTAYKSNGGSNRGGVTWESGVVNSHNLAWGAGNSMGSGGTRRVWGGNLATNVNTGTNVSNGEWNKLPNNHSNNGLNGNGNRKGSNGWKSLDDTLCGQNSSTSQLNEQNNIWAKGTADSEGSTESTGSRHDRASVGSGDANSTGGRRGEKRKPDQPGSAQSILSRTDLDPRVLCNTGWGQTPIRQNTAWDTEPSPKSDRKTDIGTEAWGGHVSQTSNSGGWGDGPGPNSNDTSSVSGWADPKPTKVSCNTGWGDTKGSSSQGGCEDNSAATGMVKSNQTWGGNKEEKVKQGWTDGQKSNQGWSMSGGDGWGENSRTSHWGEPQKANSGAWERDRDSDGDRSVAGWSEPVRPGSGSCTWAGSNNSNPNHTNGWREAAKPTPSPGWGEPGKPTPSPGWGEPGKPTPSPGWGEPGKPTPSPGWGEPGKPTPSLGWGESVKPTPSPGWGEQSKPTQSPGWGEPGKPSPSPGWGEPGKPSPSPGWGEPGKPTQSPGWGEPSKHTQSPGWGEAAKPTQSPGWGEPGKPTPSPGWGEPGKPTPSPGWGESGKPTPSPGWGEPAKPNNSPDWNKQHNSNGPKPMQDGWCAEEASVPGTRHSSWEEEEGDVMWNNNGSQDNNATNWAAKKMAQKVGLMGLGANLMNYELYVFILCLECTRDPVEEAKSNKMDLPVGMLRDKRLELDKHGLNVGEYTGIIGKGPGSRPQISKESSMDRNPYYDKNGNPNLYGGSNAAAQARGMQQPPAQPLNSSQPNLRTQVPPPLLSPQVPASLLKYTAGNGGLNPALLNFAPQQVAMLNQLSQISQLQRLLLQQQKAQNVRNMPGPLRQSPEQAARVFNVQQMLQHPRQMDTSLLMKQPQPQPMHQPSVKSFLENLMPPTPPELQTKEPPSLPSYSSYPLGLNPNLNVNSLDFGSIVNLKEPQSQQSRLKQWTALETLPVNTSLDQNSSKHGATSSGLSICSSGKLLEESPFGHFDFSGNSLVSPPGSIGDGWPSAKSPNDKLSSNVNWPPEFRPGEPWKGYQNIDPETDPYVTPGSVMTGLSISTARDLDLLRDRNNGSSSSMNTTLPSTSAWSLVGASSYNSSLSSTAQSTPARIGDPKSTWSPGPVTNTSLAHELWKVPLPPKNTTAPSRPPPGLTSHKPSHSWGNSSLRLGVGWGNSESRYTPGPSWGDISSGRITNWLVLKNLTPQIDGSTLRTLCMQHGPLITFHLNLPHGNALVCYSSKEEAAKAQKSLHMCVLGNTTILAEFASEDEINRFFAQGQSLTPSPGWQSLGSGQSRMGSMDSSHPFSNRNDLSHWNSAGLAGGGGELHGTSLWGTPNYSTSLWGSPSISETRGIGSPSPINAFLPVDHLGGGESI